MARGKCALAHHKKRLECPNTEVADLQCQRRTGVGDMDTAELTRNRPCPPPNDDATAKSPAPLISF